MTESSRQPSRRAKATERAPEQLSFDGFAAPVDPRHQLYFALVPPAPVAELIAEQAPRLCNARGIKAKLQDASRLHISLHGIGLYDAPPPEIIEKASEAAASASVAPFEIAFDQAMSFGGEALVLTGGDVRALMAFRQSLSVALIKAGLGRYANPNYTPHMTLAYLPERIVPCPVEPIRWTAHEFVLVDSIQRETKHIHLARWPLRG